MPAGEPLIEPWIFMLPSRLSQGRKHGPETLLYLMIIDQGFCSLVPILTYLGAGKM